MIFLAKGLRQRFNTISFLIFLFIIILLPIILSSFSSSSFLFIFIYWKVLWRMERHFSRSSDPMKVNRVFVNSKGGEKKENTITKNISSNYIFQNQPKNLIPSLFSKILIFAQVQAYRTLEFTFRFHHSRRELPDPFKT